MSNARSYVTLLGLRSILLVRYEKEKGYPPKCQAKPRPFGFSR